MTRSGSQARPGRIFPSTLTRGPGGGVGRTDVEATAASELGGSLGHAGSAGLQPTSLGELGTQGEPPLRIPTAGDKCRDNRLVFFERPLHDVLVRPVTLEQREMRGGDHRLGTQGDRTEAKEARDDLVGVAGRDHEQADEHEEPEDDDQLERHQTFEHRGDLAAEDQRHERGEEDGVAEPLDDHDLRQVEPRHAYLTVAGQVTEASPRPAARRRSTP